jgi:hypothetical protein
MNEIEIKNSAMNCLSSFIFEDADDIILAFTRTLTSIINKNNWRDIKGFVYHAIFLEPRETRLIFLNGASTHRSQDAIVAEIRMQLDKLDGNDVSSFLGYLIGKYAVIVPEELFRKAKIYWRIQYLSNHTRFNGDRTLLDEEIFESWQQFIFFTWLGLPNE